MTGADRDRLKRAADVSARRGGPVTIYLPDLDAWERFKAASDKSASSRVADFIRRANAARKK